MLNKQKAINDIIENFNWEKVYNAMYALGWTWHDSEGETPTTGMLFRCAMGLLHDAYDGAEKDKCDYLVGTGGFRAQAIVSEDTKEVESLRLAFEVCSWESYD
jgi:hypothetical protein